MVTFTAERNSFSPVKLTDMKRIVVIVLTIGALVVGFLVIFQKGDDARIATAQPEETSSEELRQTIQVGRSDTFTPWPTEPVIETQATTNWLARMQAGDFPSLSSEEAEAYVAASKRSAESLLAAYRASTDRTFLREALEKFPDDPKVNFAGYCDAFRNGASYTTEERRALLDRLTKSAPENSLGNFLAAYDYFNKGESDKALEQIRNAATKSSLNDYSLEFIQNAEEAYRNAGYSEADAKAIATSTLILPHLSQLKQAGVGLLDLAGRYQQSGDDVQAQEALQLALHLADMLQDGSQHKAIINQLVGISIESKVLNTLDPNHAYDNSGRTVQQRIDELAQNRKNLNANVGPMENLLPIMTPADQSAYFDRMKLFGEEAAMTWAVGKYGN
ncbi:MAG: hypothetical protein IH623_04220 [Verrucomicrobia bacterium]|nr:hypothetical protein [Verrucomicrobiota bacterium]